MNSYTNKNKSLWFYNLSFEQILPMPKEMQTIIIDPPYNIGYNYNGKYHDKKSPKDYEDMIYDLLSLCKDSAKDNASLFFINYPHIVFDLKDSIIDSGWNVHQWISWVYPSNNGFSKNKFTNAHRTILWLKNKENPKFYGDRLVEPYTELSNAKVKKLIDKGKKGRQSYNWWLINQVYNTAKTKLNYTTQLPNELINRLILSTTDVGDYVLDPMCGTGSVLNVAKFLNRKGIGIDTNDELIDIWRLILNE
tara:strand:- start:7920 stop:8669 length:750 start_codon:yes stop_codon:yes gene_type:complete